VRPTSLHGLFGIEDEPTPQPVDAGTGRVMPSGPAAPGDLSTRSWRRVADTTPKKPEPGGSSSSTELPPPTSVGPSDPAAPLFPQANHAALPGACPECGPFVGGSCCPPGNRLYVTAEYLLWWVKGSPLPALVTQGSAGDPRPGSLGFPGTITLFGDSAVGGSARSGARFMIGYWFCDQHCLGIEGGGFSLGRRNTNFSASSTGSPILSRPFFDVLNGGENFEEVAGLNPQPLAGTIAVTNRSSFWGYETNLRTNALCCGCFYTDLILGYRALGLDENLAIVENLTALTAPTGTFVVQDRFDARNRFYGGQIGAITQFQRGRWSLDLTTKMALGNTHQTVDIFGSTVTNTSGQGQQTSTGGLLALPSNIGHHSRDVVTFIPEVGLGLGYQLTDHTRLTLGYNFLYWNNVVRPGNQIDRVVNTNQIPPPLPGGPPRPAFSFNGSEFWAQGINLGLEFRY
jgi:hypothetical protein